MKPVSVTTEKVKNAVLIASFGTFAQGVNVKRLHHIVFASPSKSRYRILQSIGRGLRLHASKKVVYIMDIVDDAHDKRYHNYAVKHWAQRVQFYEEESFPVETFTHPIEGRNYE